MKKGDIVKCIDNFCVALTKDKIYKIQEPINFFIDGSDHCCVICDKGYSVMYFKNRFKKI